MKLQAETVKVSCAPPPWAQWAAGLRRLGLAVLLAGWTLPASAVTFRWSDTSYRIYITGPGAATLSDVKTALPKAPLFQVAPAVWHLRAELQIENGGTLLLHGTRIGGDVNELRLQSNNSAESNSFVCITADWGVIDIRSTFITSWDDAVQGPDTETSTFGRAFIRTRSTLTEEDLTPLESRMDIQDSEVCYLGYHEAESYGLVWKVNPPKTNPAYGDLTNVYNLVNVYGDIKDSHIHHNFFGVYTFGAYGMHMENNEVDHNAWYGFDPHDDSDSLVIENNNVHHNGTHGIIASQRCDHLIIRNNSTWSNGGCGIMLHRSSDLALIEGNQCMRNGDSGIAIFASHNNVIRHNTCHYNGKSGIRFSVGGSDNLIQENDFAYGADFGLYLYKGNDTPSPGDDGRPRRNRFVANRIHDNSGNGLFATSADDNIFTGNLFEFNYGPLRLINALGNLLQSNSIPPDVLVRTEGAPNLPCTTAICNQDAISVQVDAFTSATFSDPGNRIFDPQQEGIYTMISPSGSSLTLAAAQIGKTSIVMTRNFSALPNAGVGLVNISIWNMTGDLSKRWTTQADSSTRSISYKVGDLAPNTPYTVLKNRVGSRYTSDSNGVITFSDQAVTTGPVEFIINP